MVLPFFDMTFTDALQPVQKYQTTSFPFSEPLKIGIWRETGDYGEPTRSKRQEQPRCGL
jgi:hypothetical protein